MAGLLDGSPESPTAGEIALVARRGLVQLLIGPDPAPAWRSAKRRWLATVLAGLGAALVALAILGALFGSYLRPHDSALSELLAVASLLLVARYPLLAWRLSFVAAVLVPLLNDQLSPLQALAFVVALCVAGLRYPRPVLWAMWALTLVLAWLRFGPGWGRAALATLALTAITAAVDAVGASRGAKHALAAQAERTELEEARRAVLEERARIAREMHDVVAHHMSLVAVRSETAPYRLEGLSDETRAEFASLSEAARATLADMRRLLGALRSDLPAERAPQPQLGDIPDLVAAARRAGVRVELSLPAADGDVPPSVALCAYRIVQEALSNASRHAPGGPVSVRVEQADDVVRLQVINGPGAPGAPSPNAQRPGQGLVGMRERVTLLGGSLSTGPAPDGGFAVAAVLPLSKPVADGWR